MALPKTFTGGERLFAGDLNDNFEALDTRLGTAQSHDSSDFEVSFRPAISSTDRFFEWSPSGNTAIQQGGFLQIKMKRIF